MNKTVPYSGATILLLCLGVALSIPVMIQWDWARNWESVGVLFWYLGCVGWLAVDIKRSGIDW